MRHNDFKNNAAFEGGSAKCRGRQLIVANWKMNGNESLLISIREALSTIQSNASIAILPPFVYLPAASQHFRDANILIGAQNVNAHDEGAFTGEISANMLRDMHCHYVLVGHSERRALFGETNDTVAAKFVAVQKANMIPILCVGETLAERESGHTESVMTASLEAVVQVAGIQAFHKAVIAYEPVWAIGTGAAATPEMAQSVHQFIRQWLGKYDEALAKNFQILYGGSLNPSNAAALLSMPDIDGGLVGGASLNPDAFAEIVSKAR